MNDVQPALLPRNLQGLANLCRKEEGRYAMTGVHLITTDTGYRAEATDGRVLGRVTANYPASPAEYPALPALASAPNGQHETTIPADAWKAAFKAIPKQKNKWSRKPVLDNLAVVQGEKVTSFASTDLEAVSFSQPSNVEGHWPATDAVISQEEPVLRVRVDAKLLANLLTVAANYTAEDNCYVDLHLYSKDKPIKVTASDPATGQEFTGVIMPVAS
jgi:DNA polymerase III sliding clamp (beta) subunit (PCNA family)